MLNIQIINIEKIRDKFNLKLKQGDNLERVYGKPINDRRRGKHRPRLQNFI
jgi:hypothetical protein